MIKKNYKTFIIIFLTIFTLFLLRELKDYKLKNDCFIDAYTVAANREYYNNEKLSTGDIFNLYASCKYTGNRLIKSR